MSINDPFLISKYPNRFDEKNPWRKILFRPDKKSQLAEIHEIHSVINHNYGTNFSHLFSFYEITKPISFTLVSNRTNDYVILMSSGQVYLETVFGSYFIDIESREFTLPNNSRSYIGVLPIFRLLKDEDFLRDPLTGSNSFGDLGSNRLILDYTVLVNKDSYPLGLVEGRGPIYPPYIYYYVSKGYSNLYKDSYLTPIITDYLALRWYEEAGNYIVNGLHLSIVSNRTVLITSGKAYLEGKPILYPTSFSYELPKILNSNIDNSYSFYLRHDGTILVITSKEFTFPLDRSIYLGSIIPDKTIREYIAIPTDSRAISNSELILIDEYNKLNNRSLIELALDLSTLNDLQIREIQISGIFTDTFSSLKKSDINHPLYNASIYPSNNYLRGGITSNTITFSNVVNTLTEDINIVSKNNLPYYVAPITSERVLINQSKVTNWVTLSSQKNIPSLNIFPNKPTINSSTRTYNYIYGEIGADLIITSATIRLEASGFPALEDNLIITFGNTKITNFTLLSNTLGGTIASSIKAKLDGSLQVEFKIPDNLPNTPYVITISNNKWTASNTFNSSDNYTYQLTNGLLAQSFTVELDVVIGEINLALRKAPSISIDDYIIATVSIVNTSLGFPTKEVLSQGDLYLSAITTSSNGSSLTNIQLDKPAFLSKGKQYAIVISSNVPSNLEFFIATIGEKDISSNTSIGVQPLIGGELIVSKEGAWEKKPNSDLVFNLIQNIPSSLEGIYDFTIENPLDKINSISSILKYYCPPSTSLSFLYNLKGSWLPLKDVQPLIDSTNFIDIRAVFKSTSYTYPIFYLDNSYFIISSNKSSSTWVSKTIDLINPYTNIELSFQYYLPQGTTITPYFSSNAGESWEQFSSDFNPILVDGNIPLYTTTLTVNNLSNTVNISDINGNTSSILRRRLTIRFDLSSQDSNITPYIKRLASSVY
ncbi:DUF4815 domain-containing protein [Calothrix sp. FACHB-1219]|uniref:DUF4815 domain-containing protein n=1 Tax=unclassified Calothrix TaxID=2619626 RepID=UPI0016853DAD|nr:MULTISPECIES: DUF4815 domain-containing protein [unclassified Calothrix]MBD2201530.1 DUF4815 domain-containing protein [Calothrix sp. FACHB-168]MBD2217216.1 DUF4815 domain-containing protein [Calothrix sp. FACHB-1219]